VQSNFKLARNMEAKLHALLAEMQELKNKVREMEDENSRLRRELAAVHREGFSCNSTGVETSVSSYSFFNLLELYDQNFHICNLSFGHKRSGECLYCMAFLRKGREPAADQSASG